MAEKDTDQVVAPKPGYGAIDITLIDAMLKLTPRERVVQNDRMLQTIEKLREGMRRHKKGTGDE